MQTKQCSKCKRNKKKPEFWKQITNKDGLHSWCKDCQRKLARNNYHIIKKKNPQKLKDYANKWRSNNIDRARELARNSWHRRRLGVLKYYSNGKPKCACCGETEIEFLSIDHINGGGLKESREKGYGRGGLMRWIINNNYPKGFQILCHNCNFAKGHYGECPHKK